MKRVTFAIATALCILALLAGCGNADTYKAGTYTAAAVGYAGVVEVEVDAVASATVTSDAIKAAVKDCIEQAKSK
ncbi:FMN-binding protein [Clostridium sp. WB02_MRS01]|uniref:FMN-binding protein n=1 Tax=Clostridium sp. WB02_MRS01 TaxID=2605777 RepID=UPI0012B3EF25|nr:FMN-binding protein [Clostridium sp. WB02_MRS01]MSS08870.1 FMN-binding protein [Clostridium sp. WB02_MRS01]